MSQDFMVMMAGDKIELFCLKGLRNYPNQGLQVSSLYSIAIPSSEIPQLQLIVDASNDSLTKGNSLIADEIKLTCTTKQNQLVTMRKELDSKAPWSIEGLESLNVSDKTSVDKVSCSDSLPVLAMA